MPATAGLIRSSGLVMFQWKGDAVWMIALALAQAAGLRTHSTPLTASSKALSCVMVRPFFNRTYILQIGHYDVVKVVQSPILVHLFHPLAFGVIASRAADRVPLLQKVQGDPTGNVAVRAGYKD